MQTSESGISAKSLRGRDSTRKQDSSEKVRRPRKSLCASVPVIEVWSIQGTLCYYLVLPGFYIPMVYRHKGFKMVVVCSHPNIEETCCDWKTQSHGRNCELSAWIIISSRRVLTRWEKWHSLQHLGTISSYSRGIMARLLLDLFPLILEFKNFCLCVCGACVSVLRFGVLAAESFRGTWSVFVCPLTGQCPHGLSCLPSLSLCKYWMAARGGVATKFLSSCWGWVAEGNRTCRLWQCLKLLLIQVIE